MKGGAQMCESITVQPSRTLYETKPSPYSAQRSVPFWVLEVVFNKARQT